VDVLAIGFPRWDENVVIKDPRPFAWLLREPEAPYGDCVRIPQTQAGTVMFGDFIQVSVKIGIFHHDGILILQAACSKPDDSEIHLRPKFPLTHYGGRLQNGVIVYRRAEVVSRLSG
jgi:hypothetical protein